MLNRILVSLLFLGLATAPQAHAQAKGGAVLTLADAPLRLIRGSTVYKAGNGVALQKDDILETGAGGAQVEAGPDAIVALGPQTRVLFASAPADARAGTEVALLQGWIKVQAKGGRASVITPALRVALNGGSTIVRADGQDAVFAEEGEQAVAQIEARLDKLDAKAKPFKLVSEQYAALEPGKPQFLTGRPPRAFVTAMPPSFRDRLARAPNVANAGKVAPAKEREADFADVGPWLQAPPSLRRNFVARFKPRLADPAFRKALDAALGQNAEWKSVLHPAQNKDHQEKSP